MSALKTRTEAILALTPTEDQTGKEGCAVKASGAAAALVNADTDIPLGVILDGQDTSGKSTVQLCEGASGTVRVRLSSAPGSVGLGTYLSIGSDATFKQAISAKTMCARAAQAGAAGELIEAVLFRPVTVP